jgi:hypothetical protein
MIIYVATERFSSTMRHYLRHFRKELSGIVSVLSYEELFFEKAAPRAHYIFTDFDRLSRYELQCAAIIAKAVRHAEPLAQILNHPLCVKERYALLIALHRAGINDFTAMRLETEARPDRYPVFIRSEDGYDGPETALLHDDAEFDAAVAELDRRGLPRRGRIAIGFANKPDADGYFHKYGAFNIGGAIVPHDRMFGRNWIVKMRYENDRSVPSYDEAYAESAAGIARELEYIRANPHEAELKRAFRIAGIDYGRADYGVVDGRIQIYEINTNPHLTAETAPDARVERLDRVQSGTLSAFRSIDRFPCGGGYIRFDLPRPHAHDLRWPRRRLPISLLRSMTRRLWRKA